MQRVQDTTPPGQSEPVNIIISGASSAAVLVDQQDNGGLRNYYLCVWRFAYLRAELNSIRRSLGFSSECLGQHMGNDQQANLGDGNGYRAFINSLTRRHPLNVL